jgi:hypothetical protein
MTKLKPVDNDKHVTDQVEQEYRLFVSGFKEPISQKDVEQRFSSFGTLGQVCIPQSETGILRPFLHFSLHAKKNELVKLQQVYNGTRWKGGQLSIQVAQTNYCHRLSKEKEQIQKENRNWDIPWDKYEVHAPSKKRRWQVGVVADAVESKDLSPLIGERAEKNHSRLWKYGRGGRMVTVMRRLRGPPSKMGGADYLTVDPVLYKDGLQPLYGNASTKSVSQLSWTVPEWEESASENEYDDDLTTGPLLVERKIPGKSINVDSPKNSSSLGDSQQTSQNNGAAASATLPSMFSDSDADAESEDGTAVTDEDNRFGTRFPCNYKEFV